MYVRFSPCVCWFVFLTSWFLNTVRVVFCFYLKKSARCNGRNVVVSSVASALINITPFVFVEVLLASDFTRRTMNFKISNIPGNSVYIKKKSLHLNLVTNFCSLLCPETTDFAQIFHIAARKIMLLPKYFLVTARKF